MGLERAATLRLLRADNRHIPRARKPALAATAAGGGADRLGARLAGCALARPAIESSRVRRGGRDHDHRLRRGEGVRVVWLLEEMGLAYPTG